jgi:predicted transcriptional regulator
MKRFNLRKETVRLIKSAPLNVVQVAHLVGVEPATVYNFLNGTNTGVDTVQAMYDVLAKLERKREAA